jgi:hypothetical protein
MKVIFTGCIHCGALTQTVNGVCQDCESIRSRGPRRRVSRPDRIRKGGHSRRPVA